MLVLGWVVYPYVTLLVARRRGDARKPAAHHVPVSVVVATREAPAAVASRVANVWTNGYPRELLQIIVAVDKNTGFSLSDYRQALGEGVTLVEGDGPGGKACALNAGTRAASADLIVFADSAPMYREGAIAALVGYLQANPNHGAVTGLLEVGAAAGDRDAVLDRFWNFELALRSAQARLHSVCAVTGCIYALRRQLWQPLPAGAICDDLFVPMQVIASGHRVGVCETARATDVRCFTREQQFRRKVRTLTGMLQFVIERPWVLTPWRNPVWLQFVCHKLLRIATPFLALIGGLTLLAGLVAAGATSLLAAAAATVVCVALLVGVLKPAAARQIGGTIGWTLLLLCAPFVAVWNAVRGRWDVWPRHVVPSA